jgi:hypothetical protein
MRRPGLLDLLLYVGDRVLVAGGTGMAVVKGRFVVWSRLVPFRPYSAATKLQMSGGKEEKNGS